MRRVTQRAATVLVVGATGLPALVGCGGSDGTDDPIEGVEARRDDLDEPAATDPDSVRPFIEALLEQHDEIVNDIVANPGVARDTESPLIQDFIGLYEPGSPIPEQFVESWVEMSAAGESMRPADPDHLVGDTIIDGRIEANSPDEIRFPICDRQRFVVYGADDQVKQEVPYGPRRGEGWAVRVDGRWYLQRLDVTSIIRECAPVEGESEGES